MIALIIAVVTIKFTTLMLYVAPFIPIVTAAATKLNAPSWLKVSMTAGLATAVAIVTTAITRSADLILTWSMLGQIAMAFGIAMGSYLFLRKPIADPVAKATPGTGIG